MRGRVPRVRPPVGSAIGRLAAGVVQVAVVVPMAVAVVAAVAVAACLLLPRTALAEVYYGFYPRQHDFHNAEDNYYSHGGLYLVGLSDGSAYSVESLDGKFAPPFAGTLRRLQQVKIDGGSGPGQLPPLAHFKVVTSHPMLIFMGGDNFGLGAGAFFPGPDTRAFSARSFVVFYPLRAPALGDSSRVFVFAHQPAEVIVRDAGGNTVATRQLAAGSSWDASAVLPPNQVSTVSASGDISIQLDGGNGCAVVPPPTTEESCQGDVGRDFSFATSSWYDQAKQPDSAGAVGVFAYAAAQVQLRRLADDSVVDGATLAAGGTWFRSGLLLDSYRLVSDARVAVWAGDTQTPWVAGTLFTLGDDIAVSRGAGGTDIHFAVPAGYSFDDQIDQPISGAVIFAGEPGTVLTQMSGGAPPLPPACQTLDADRYCDLLARSYQRSLYHLAASKPVVVQTIYDSQNALDDWGEFLRPAGSSPPGRFGPETGCARCDADEQCRPDGRCQAGQCVALAGDGGGRDGLAGDRTTSDRPRRDLWPTDAAPADAGSADGGSADGRPGDRGAGDAGASDGTTDDGGRGDGDAGDAAVDAGDGILYAARGGCPCNIGHRRGHSGRGSGLDGSWMVGMVALAGLRLAVASCPRRRRVHRRASILRSRSSHLALLALSLLLPSLPSVAYADDSGRFDIHRLQPLVGPDDLVSVAASSVVGHLKIRGGLYASFALRPLVIASLADNQTVAEVVGSRLTLDALIALGLWNRLELSLALPVTLWQQSDPAFAQFGGEVRSVAMGDVRFTPRGAILDNRRGGFGLGLAVTLAFPTGSQSSFSGDGTVSVTPRLLADYRSRRRGIVLALNLGAKLRRCSQYSAPHLAPVRAGSALVYGLGISVPLLKEKFYFLGELAGGAAFQASEELGYSARDLPLELTLALRSHLRNGLTMTMGTGPGLTPAYGTPQVRFIFGLGWAPPARLAVPPRGSPSP